eukprot:gene17923-biopygen18920
MKLWRRRRHQRGNENNEAYVDCALALHSVCTKSTRCGLPDLQNMPFAKYMLLGTEKMVPSAAPHRPGAARRAPPSAVWLT